MAKEKANSRNSTGQITDIRKYMTRTTLTPGKKRKALYDTSSDDEIVIGTKRIAERNAIGDDASSGDEIVVAARPSSTPRSPLANLSPEQSQNKRRRVLASVCVERPIDDRDGNRVPTSSGMVKSIHAVTKSPKAPRSDFIGSKRPQRAVKRASVVQVAAVSDDSDDELSLQTVKPSLRATRKKTRLRSPSVSEADFASETSADDFSAAPSSEDSPTASEEEQIEDDIIPKRKAKGTRKSLVSKAASSSSKKPNAKPSKMNKSASRGTAKNMVNLTKRRVAKGLDRSLPPLHDNEAIFQDMTSRAMDLGFADVVEDFTGHRLKLATMCSGTEAPVLALKRVQQNLRSTGFEIEHVFSVEIEPFKQAYIQRNFKPPLLFRDLTEFIGMCEGSDGITATTAYGSQQPIPMAIDILVVGSPCVDFSNRNNHKKGIDDGGESGTVLAALMDYCRAARPRIVILENVMSAPWDTMLGRFADMDYVTTGFHVDTKDFYIPHTRQRGYMICYDRRRLSSVSASDLQQSTSALMEKFKRPASSPVSAFLQPAGSIAESNLAHVEDTKKKSDWEVCHARHITYREQLGIDNARPYTNWQESGVAIPLEHSDSQAIAEQSDRVKDFLDVAHLRKLKMGGIVGPIDSRFKERYWDVSQNVDLSTDSTPAGIISCITASCAYWVPHLGRFLTGTELLMLQGIPMDLISFTTETPKELTDLAGNAMSATVVCAAMLSALIAGLPILTSERSTSTPTADAQVVPETIFIPQNSSVSKAVSTERVINMNNFLALAAKTARHCHCEGQTKITPNSLQVCQDCGHTSCVSCGGNPEHHYATDHLLAKDRSQPSQFVDYVSKCFPLRLQLCNVPIPDTFVSSAGLNEEHIQMYLELIKRMAAESYGFKECQRSREWTIVYISESSGSRLELLLTQTGAEWRLLGRPPSDLPDESVARQLFEQPIAKAKVVDSLFDVGWQVRCPFATTRLADIIATGPRVPTLWARFFRGEENHTQPSEISIQCSENPTADLSGTYKLLPRCGTSLDSMYQRLGPGTSLYLFHDPHCTNPPEFDPFVFSHDKERVDQSRVRPIEASIDPTWKPWNMNKEQEQLSILAYDWMVSPASPGLSAMPLGAEVRTVLMTDLNSSAGKCDQMAEIINVSNLAHLRADAQLLGDSSWISALIRQNLDLDTWQPYSIDHDTSVSCETCAPSKPLPTWGFSANGQAIERSEDPWKAAEYEFAVKARPYAARLQILPSGPTSSVSLGVNLTTIAHRARSQLPGDLDRIEYQWRLTDRSDSEDTFTFKPFQLKAPEAVAPFTNELQMTIRLFPNQQTSLAWMRSQEQGREYALAATREAVVPQIGLRAEVCASSRVTLRGGICAHHPGFGKTILSLALIQSQFLEQNHNSIMREIEGRARGPAKRLLSTSATLIVCPATLVQQWVDEIKDKLNYSEGVYYIHNIQQFDKFTVKDLEGAKIIVLNRKLLTSAAYIERLAAFGALPEPVGYKGRAFRDWLHAATIRAREHVETLKSDGVMALRRSLKERYDRDIESETFTARVPSRRLRGKDYAPAAAKTKQKRESQRAPLALDVSNVSAPPFEVCYFNRIIYDEYHQGETKDLASMSNLQSDKTWGLSGTPAIGDCYEVAQNAKLLGMTLSVGSTRRGIMKNKSSRAYFADATSFERFDDALEKVSESNHRRTHEQCQRFLNIAVRRDVLDFTALEYDEHLVPVTLDLSHQVLYTELSTHLNTHEMKIRKRGSNTDREARHSQAIEDCVTAEDALSKAAVYYPRVHDEEDSSDQGLDALIQRRQREVFAFTEELDRAIFDAQFYEPENFSTWKTSKLERNGIGDAQVSSIVRDIVERHKASNTTPTQRNAREEQKEGQLAYTSTANAVMKRLLVSQASLRFIENVRKVQSAKSTQPRMHDCSHSDCSSVKTEDIAVSVQCGHVVCSICYDVIKDYGRLQCPAEGCSSPMRMHHLFWRSKMADSTVTTAPAPFGAKIAAAIDILTTIREKNEQAILFVQYEAHISLVESALQARKIPAAIISGRNAAKAVTEFQEAGGKNKKTVIVLNASEETAAGLNLQNANHVIFLAPLLRDQQYAYDATMAQAKGRVLRHGQERKVHVYRVFALDTIDVDVLEHRERRTDALVELDGKGIEKPGSLDMIEVDGADIERERTQLVRDADGKFSLRPQSWLLHSKLSQEEQDRAASGGTGNAGWKGRRRVAGWEDFSSLVKFSRVYTEDD